MDSFIKFLEFVNSVFIATWFSKISISKEDMDNGYFDALKEKLEFLYEWSNNSLSISR